MLPFLFYFPAQFAIECCPGVRVESRTKKHNDLLKAHPKLFTNYFMEAGMVHGRHHYTSEDGHFALAYNSASGAWWIQPEVDRGGQRGFAFVRSTETCAHDVSIGERWSYAQGEWRVAGEEEVFVRCVSSSHVE